MEGKRLRIHLPLNKGGVTLIELLVALVIGSIVVAGIYRVFVAQTRAYTIQDQVVEVQQSIRSAMEVILRDLRMAGYDGDQTPSRLLTAIFPGDAAFSVKDDAVTIQYRTSGGLHLNTKVIFRNAPTSELMENLFVDGVQDPNYKDPNNPVAGIVLLGNVKALTFTYGVDGTVGNTTSQDGYMDDMNGDTFITDADFVPAATVTGGNLNVIAVRVTLTASPTASAIADNPDAARMVQPRTLVSAITLRNLCLVKTN
jgi:prepilin-type N-terminal cleavage/methylation domain-containing protein